MNKVGISSKSVKIIQNLHIKARYYKVGKASIYISESLLIHYLKGKKSSKNER